VKTASMCVRTMHELEIEVSQTDIQMAFQLYTVNNSYMDTMWSLWNL